MNRAATAVHQPGAAPSAKGGVLRFGGWTRGMAYGAKTCGVKAGGTKIILRGAGGERRAHGGVKS